MRKDPKQLGADVAHYAAVGKVPESNVFILSAQDGRGSKRTFAERIANTVRETGKGALVVDDLTVRGPYELKIPAGNNAEKVLAKLEGWSPEPFL